MLVCRAMDEKMGLSESKGKTEKLSLREKVLKQVSGEYLRSGFCQLYAQGRKVEYETGGILWLLIGNENFKAR